MTYFQFKSILLSFAAALLIGLFAGWLNGFIVVRFGIPSLVATIGTQFFWRGAVLVLSQNKNGSLAYAMGTPLYNILVGKLFGVIPMQMVWLIVIAILSWVLLNRTRFGAHIYLIGDNAESAKLMGVNCGKVRIRAFMLVGVVAALAGVIASLHVKFFWPSLGDGYLLRTLASVFLGGTSVFGGVGTIFGTFIGAFIIGAIEAATVAVGSDRLLDPVDLRLDYPHLGDHAQLPAQADGVSTGVVAYLSSAEAEFNLIRFDLVEHR